MTDRLRIIGVGLLLLVVLSVRRDGGSGPSPNPAPDDRHRVMVVYTDGMPSAQASVASSSRWVSWASTAEAEFRRVEHGEDVSGLELHWQAMRSAATSPPQVVIAKGGKMRVAPVADSWDEMQAEVDR